MVAADELERARSSRTFTSGARKRTARSAFADVQPRCATFEPHVRGAAHALRSANWDCRLFPSLHGACCKNPGAWRAGGNQRKGRQAVAETRSMDCLTTAGEFVSDFLITCAGLHADHVSELAGIKRFVRILPFRGEYLGSRNRASICTQPHIPGPRSPISIPGRPFHSHDPGRG